MKKILLIEDNNDIRENTAEILELSNYHVILAENGIIGVEKAIEYAPDLIICDIMMPGLDGYGVLHSVHKNEGIKNTPFIFLTAKTERSEYRKGMELGADDYITKPFEGIELLNAVDSRLKKLDLLKKELTPSLEGLHPMALKNFTEGRNINIYKKKQVIYSQGNHPNMLYYVVKGKVKTFKTNEYGKELVIELYSPGDFLGYITLLEQTTYRDTAKALEETQLAIIPKEEFEELLNKSPEAAKKFIQLLAKDITAQENHLLGLAYNSLRKKVAEALIMLQKKYSTEQDEIFATDISRENLASIAGTATESLIRTLSHFRNKKIIEIEGGSIKIINYKKLEKMVN